MIAPRLPATLAVVAFLLAACATKSPPVPAQAGVAVPAQWSQPVPPGAGALAGWWAGFGDPLLTQLVGDAMAGNTDIGIARANLLQARAAREEAAAVLWPQASASLSAQRGALAGGRPQNSFQAGFDASWEADLFGGNRHAVAAADAAAGASAATLGATQVSIAAEVAQSYLQMRGAQVRIAVARENLASQQETLQISEWRRQAGLANDVEVEQARSAVEQTRAQVPLLQASAAQLAHALGVLTGRPPEVLLRQLSVPAPLPRLEAQLGVEVPAEALAHRPDVQAAERKLQAAAERVGQAQAARYPTLDLAASVAWSGVTLGSLGGVSAARSLLAALTQPLFDAGARRAQLAGRDAEFQAALETYRASVLAALQDVEDALVALSTGEQRLAALQSALDAARNAALLATQRHASGLIDFQTVLETQRTLLNVQDSVAGAQTDLATGHVRLYKALGGGWQPAQPENRS